MCHLCHGMQTHYNHLSNLSPILIYTKSIKLTLYYYYSIDLILLEHPFHLIWFHVHIILTGLCCVEWMSLPGLCFWWWFGCSVNRVGGSVFGNEKCHASTGFVLDLLDRHVHLQLQLSWLSNSNELAATVARFRQRREDKPCGGVEGSGVKCGGMGVIDQRRWGGYFSYEMLWGGFFLTLKLPLWWDRLHWANVRHDWAMSAENPLDRPEFVEPNSRSVGFVECSQMRVTSCLCRRRRKAFRTFLIFDFTGKNSTARQQCWKPCPKWKSFESESKHMRHSSWRLDINRSTWFMSIEPQES